MLREHYSVWYGIVQAVGILTIEFFSHGAGWIVAAIAAFIAFALNQVPHTIIRYIPYAMVLLSARFLGYTGLSDFLVVVLSLAIIEVIARLAASAISKGMGEHKKGVPFSFTITPFNRTGSGGTAPRTRIASKPNAPGGSGKTGTRIASRAPGSKPKTTVQPQPDLFSGQMAVFGTPGEGLNSGPFSEGQTAAGIEGEKKTSNLISNQLGNLGYPVKLFNSMYYVDKNGKKLDADIDHVLLVGNLGFLIDSKLYKKGSYFLRDQGTIECAFPDGTQKQYTNNMYKAHNNYKSVLKKNGVTPATKSYIVIHSSNGAQINSGRSGNVFLGTWNEVKNDILNEVRVNNTLASQNNDKSVPSLNTYRK